MRATAIRVESTRKTTFGLGLLAGDRLCELCEREASSLFYTPLLVLKQCKGSLPRTELHPTVD
jgi:hypothetical protein